MAIQVQNTALTSTFDFWRNRTNELAYAMSNYVVTAGGDPAQGDAVLTGNFTSNNIYANNAYIKSSIKIGNNSSNATVNTTVISLVNTTANYIITIPTAEQIANSHYYLNANSVWSPLMIPDFVSNGTVVTATASRHLIDRWQWGSAKTAEYLISMTDNISNGFQTSKLLVFHDTGQAYVTEYAQMWSNNQLGVWSVSFDSSNVSLYCTTTSTNETIKFSRILT
jgi:hypothetical protein